MCVFCIRNIIYNIYDAVKSLHVCIYYCVCSCCVCVLCVCVVCVCVLCVCCVCMCVCECVCVVCVLCVCCVCACGGEEKKKLEYEGDCQHHLCVLPPICISMEFYPSCDHCHT